MTRAPRPATQAVRRPVGAHLYIYNIVCNYLGRESRGRRRLKGPRSGRARRQRDVTGQMHTQNKTTRQATDGHVDDLSRTGRDDLATKSIQRTADIRYCEVAFHA